MVWNHGLDILRTMVLKSPSAITSMCFSIARCQGGDSQDHGSERVQTTVQDHGFARVGTMQVQAIMPPSIGISRKWAEYLRAPRCGKAFPPPPLLGDPPLGFSVNPPPYTRETGTIWQIGVLTAEWSTFWAQKMRF